MSDLENDLEEVGRGIWPIPREARDRLHRRGYRRRGAVVVALRPVRVGAVAVAALILAGSVTGVVILAGNLSLRAAPNPAFPAAQAGVSGGIGPAGHAFAGATTTTAATDAAAERHAGAATAPVGQVTPAGSGHLPPSPPFTPLPSPGVQPGSVGGVVTLTVRSRGVYPVQVGATIVVDLTGVGWGMPSSSSSQVIRFEKGSTAPNGDVTATFIVVSAGQATIQASETLRSGPALLWQVEVSASSS